MNYHALIHLAKKELGLDDEMYRDMLEAVTGKRSMADMDRPEMDAVLRHLQQKGFRIVLQDRPATARRAPEADPQQPGDMATARQLRMLEALWRNCARNPEESAFRRFLKNRFGVESPCWLRAEHVTKVKQALERMNNPATEARSTRRKASEKGI